MAKTTEEAIGPVWAGDAEVYEIPMKRRSTGEAVTATFQWHEKGGILGVPMPDGSVADIAVPDARSDF